MDKYKQEPQSRIVVHPKWVDLSERLGVGCTVCKDIDTGEKWKEYDLGEITRAERRFQEVIHKDQITGYLLTLGILYAIAKKKVKKLFP